MVYYVVGYFEKPILAESMDLEMIKKDHHITLYPGFDLAPEYTPDLFQLVKNISEEYSPIPVTLGGDDKFYSKTLEEEFLVKLVTPNVDLTTIHNRLNALLMSRGAVVANPSFTGEGYTPHISHYNEDIDLKLKYIGISRSILKGDHNEIRNIGRFPFRKA